MIAMEYNPTECCPQKCGIIVKPPCFCLVYTSGDKLRKKVMPLRQFKTNSNIKFVAHDLKKRHNLENVPVVKIEKMLKLLQELLKGTGKDEAKKIVDSEYSIKSTEDLSKLPTRELEVQKQLMDSLFLKNQVKKDNPEFVYDKQIEFGQVTEESNWDRESSADSGDFWN